MILKHVLDLSSSTKIILGIEFDSSFTAQVKFVIQNVRNIEIPLSLQCLDNYCKNSKKIRDYLEKSSIPSEVTLDSKTILRFVQFNEDHGVTIRGERFHVSFLGKAAIQLLVLQNTISALYNHLQRQVEEIPSKIKKIKKIANIVLNKAGKSSVNVEDVLSHEKIDKTCQLETQLIAYYFNEIYSMEE
jgi:site-specific recombinase XerC